VTGDKVQIHPTQKPIKLYEYLLKEFSKEGDFILDSHVGSGSSRIACYKNDLNFIGYEINEDYFKAQDKRYRDFTAQVKLF